MYPKDTKIIYDRKRGGYKLSWRGDKGQKIESIETYLYRSGAEMALKPDNEQEKSHWEDRSFI